MNFKKLYPIGIILGVALAFGVPVAALSTFIVPQGGTGRTTFPSGNLIYGSLTAPLQNVATTSVTCAGTASCSQFTVIGSSPITITGSGGGGGTYPFTPKTYAGNQVSATSSPIWDTATTFPAFIASSTFSTYLAATSTYFTQSSSSQLTNTGSTWLTGLTQGLVANDANHLLYGTATGTLSGSGAITVTAGSYVIGGNVTVACATCNTSSATVTSITFGQGLGGGTITTAGTGWLLSYLSTSSSETSGQIPFWTTTNGTPAQFSGGDATFTFTSASKKLIFLNGTSTNLSATGSFFAPTVTTLPVNNISSQVSVNTTSASSSLQFGINSLFATTSVSFSWSTTTPSTAATDTVMIITGPRAQKFDNIACGVLGGTATISVGNGVATSTYYQAKALSTVPVPLTITANNTFTPFTPIFIAIGTYSVNTISNVSCGLGREYTY